MYNEYQPSLLLAPYIDKYWEFKGNPDYGMKINILPDGCTDFIFTLGEVADIAEQESLIMQPYRSYFVGPMSRYSTLITYAKSIHMFGIRFLPCGLFRFMQLPLEELGNQRISTFESGGIFNDSLAERLCEQPYIQDKIRLIESFLTQALCTNNKIEKQISYAVDCINLSKGQLPIRSLVENVCLCQRHFERKFKHQTGYSPKEYSRIIKFKNAVDLLRSTSSNQLFSVAIEAGYYDTAHLSNDRCAACNRPRYHCGKMAEQTEAGRQRRGGNLSLSAASRSADVPCPGLGCRKRRNSVVTGSGKNRRRFRESVSTRDSCAGTGRADRGDTLQTACGIPERRPECSGSDKRCRVSYYCSKKRIILTAERI